ncbi:MAG: hypothetical protein BWK79_16040 [Beggiatoa sp. IS2]|nr:MAG: hypothetical protein BWK79_16040 [Beggiatoa sp. IS2]
MTDTEGSLQNRYRTYLREFIEGATKPSIAALLGTLGVAGVVFLACLTVITPKFMATTGYGYFMTNPVDEFAYLTSETLRIVNTNPQPVSVILVGTSSTREALAGTHDLEQLLAAKIQQPVNVYDLTSGNLNHWEAACMLDSLRGHFHGVAVLEISTLMLAYGHDRLQIIADQPRLALDCPAFTEELRLASITVPPTSANYFLRHYKFFISRSHAILLNLIRGPVVRNPNKIAGWGAPSAQRRKMGQQRFLEVLDVYQANSPPNFAVYQRMMAASQANGQVKVALVEALRNPEIDEIMFTTKPAGKQVYAEYQATVTQFAQQNATPYWDIGSVAHFKAADFSDHTHLQSPTARQQYTEMLATHLAELLTQN